MVEKTKRKTLTLSRNVKPTPSQPSGGVLVGVGEQGWSVVRYEERRGEGLAQGVGRWLLDEGLYSSGNDFTSERAKNPSHIGISAMKNLWEGNASSLDEIFFFARIWVAMKGGRPQAVVALFHPRPGDGRGIFYRKPRHQSQGPGQQVQVERIGHLMAYVRPEHRQKGLLRWVMSNYILPEVEERARQARSEGAIPLVGASDALGKVMANYTDLPVTEHMEYCPEMNHDIWRIIRQREVAYEKVHGVDQYLVQPQPMKQSPGRGPRKGRPHMR